MWIHSETRTWYDKNIQVVQSLPIFVVSTFTTNKNKYFKNEYKRSAERDG